MASRSSSTNNAALAVQGGTPPATLTLTAPNSGGVPYQGLLFYQCGVSSCPGGADTQHADFGGCSPGPPSSCNFTGALYFPTASDLVFSGNSSSTCTVFVAQEDHLQRVVDIKRLAVRCGWRHNAEQSDRSGGARRMRRPMRERILVQMMRPWLGRLDARLRGFRARRSLPRGWRSARNAGSAAVEFAITVPLLVVVALGAADYGTMAVQQAALEGATRAGAEWARANCPPIPSDEPLHHRDAEPGDRLHDLLADFHATSVTAVCTCANGSSVSCAGTCSVGTPRPILVS